MIDEKKLNGLIGRIMAREAINSGVKFETANYSPHKPTTRQKLFLDLQDEEEVFYGGAAGGGKSDALLMAAIEFVNVSGYAALMLRKTYADLSRPGALMDRAFQWFSSSSAEWSAERHQWTFSSGATLTFGHLQTENDKYKYQSSEFQFIGFDELTHFSESQYLYLFSRLRRLVNVNIPLRMRSASNPPQNPSGLWVKARFIPSGFSPDDALKEKIWSKEYIDQETGATKKTYFVPARLDDNPHIDRDQYTRSLAKLDSVTRAQLRLGDWQISVSGDILFDWRENQVIVTWSNFQRAFKLKEPKIPGNWQLGIFQDWGATRDHPCVTGWFSTVSENTRDIIVEDPFLKKEIRIKMAGSVFWYRTHIRTYSRATEIKKEILDYMLPDNELYRCHTWQMSHEALSERLEYNASDNISGKSLPFSNWPAGYTRGIEQLKSAIIPSHLDEPHPFNPGVSGRPKLFILVDDDQEVAFNTVTDGLDRGQSRVRSEAPAYKWDTPKSGEIPSKLRPYPLFNDALDVARAAAASYWPQMEELTSREVLSRRVEERLPELSTEELYREGRQIAEAIVRAQEIKKMKEDYGADFLGDDDNSYIDISKGW